MITHNIPFEDEIKIIINIRIKETKSATMNIFLKKSIFFLNHL